MSEDLERKISGALMRLKRRSPFFATLCLFARLRPDDTLPTAATNGTDILYNPKWLAEVARRPAQFDGVIVHEVLHAALLHVQRRKHREPVRWNIAADVVVNGMIANQPGLEVLPGAIRAPRFEHLQVEEVYALIPEPEPGTTGPGDLLDGVGDAQALARAEAHWRAALQQAAILAQSGQGRLPAGLLRELDVAGRPQVDWRAALWRCLTRTPDDYRGFDRRHLARGLYLDALEGERLRVYVAVDTSGSISSAQLADFLAEVEAILRAYPHVDAQLYFADAALYGPWPLRRDHPMPTPEGGGGTRFEPFFEAVADDLAQHGGEAALVYLTDGYGSFPKLAPAQHTLWVVTPGGLEANRFPFGEIVRLI